MNITVLVGAQFLLGNLLFAAAAITYVRNRAKSPAALRLTLTLSALALWTYARMFAHNTTDIRTQFLWMCCAHITNVIAPVCWLWTTSEYTLQIRPAQRKWLLLFALPVLISSVLVWTTQSHGLVWKEFRQLPAHPHLFTYTWGWVGQIVVIYIGMLNTTSTILILRRVWVGPGLNFRQNWPSIAGIIAPMLTYIAFITNLTKGFDLTMFGLAVTVWVYGFGGITSFRLIDLMPARDTVLEQLTDGVIVLGKDNRLLDLNPSAKYILGIADTKHLSWLHLLEQKINVPAQQIPTALGLHEFRCEVVSTNQADKIFEMKGRIFRSANQEPLGRIITLSDITARMLAERDLQILNQSFESQLLARTDELRLTAARLVNTQEAERARIARELHDQVGAHLSVMGMAISMARAAVATPVAPETQTDKQLERVEGLLQETSGIIRRLMADLHPPELEESGLIEALRWLGEQWAAHTQHTVSVQGDDIANCLGTEARIAFYRIAQEALSNVARHAGAHQVWITVKYLFDRQQISMTIRDDGVGFVADTTTQVRTQQSGWGMTTIRERALAIGGRCEIASQIGVGTEVHIFAPCEQPSLPAPLTLALTAPQLEKLP